MMSLIKRILGIKKANKGGVDTQVDFEVADLKTGFILDYDFKSWEVKDVVIYTWDNGVKDYEYNIFDGREMKFLSYETVGNAISIFWKENLNDVWPDARGRIRNNQDITNSEFVYKGNKYYFSGEGTARVKSATEIFTMQNWLFENDSDDSLISFNKYEDNSMEVYVGKKLKTHEISNILPRK